MTEEANESNSCGCSKKRLALVVLLAASLVTTATVATIFATKGATKAEDYVVDLVGYEDDTMTDPDQKCIHSEIEAGEVREMMHSLEVGGNVTVWFHLGDSGSGGGEQDQSFVFNSEMAEATDEKQCFETFDGGRFCFEPLVPDALRDNPGRYLMSFTMFFSAIFDCFACNGPSKSNDAS